MGTCEYPGSLCQKGLSHCWLWMVSRGMVISLGITSGTQPIPYYSLMNAIVAVRLFSPHPLRHRRRPVVNFVNGRWNWICSTWPECTHLLPVCLLGHVTLHRFLVGFIFPGIISAGRQTLRGRFADFARVARGWEDIGFFDVLGWEVDSAFLEHECSVA